MPLIEHLLTPGQAAQRAGVTVRTIRRWVASGHLIPAYKLAGPTGMSFYDPADIDRITTTRDENVAS